MNKYIAKVIWPLFKVGTKFLFEASFQNVQHIGKSKTFQAKNRLVCLADTPEANLIKAKLTENTNLNRQYCFINFLAFFGQ